jgi:hypothetical protein
MMKRWFGALLVASFLVLPASHAGGKKPGKDFYKILVKPSAKWEVWREGAGKGGKERIVVETYDVRKVGDADVARIRWTHHLPDGTKEDIGATDSGKPTQVAVTPAGLFLLNAENDDAKVAERLKGKPSRSSPPKAYAGTNKNNGRYLSIDNAGTVCMGFAPLKDEERECEDTCEGEVCISATRGVVELSGTYAPSFEIFKAR